MKTYIKITWEWDGSQYVQTSEESYEHDGPVALCCGAAQGQKDIANQQTSAYKTMLNQAQQEFGGASGVFSDLMKTFEPVVAAGPDQEGFSQAEKSALQSSAITNAGNAYRNAKQAVGDTMAAQGGGNVGDVTGGYKTGINLSVAESAAKQTADSLNEIDQADYATGRQNYKEAVAGMESAPGVFGTANSAENVATGGGEAAANTENQIAQQDNSWVGAVTGALGNVAGIATGGIIKNLGSGVAKAATGRSN